MTETARTMVDLSNIAHLASKLPNQAVHTAGAHLPGGAAMVTLAPVGEHWRWERRTQIAERTGNWRTAPHLEDPDTAWPPLQILRYWSEQWRAHTDTPTAHPTLEGEARFLHSQIEQAHHRLSPAEWAAFAADVATARRRLEDVLSAGDRHEKGAPCPDCRTPLIRKLQRYRKADGTVGWRHSDWHCPACRYRATPVEYDRMVATAAHEGQREDINGAGAWCSTAYAAEAVGRPEATVRSWVHRGHVATVCLLRGRRTGYVSLDDVQARHDLTSPRKVAQ